MTLDVVTLLNEIAEIGRDPVRGGYSRHVYEPAELELREWFRRTSDALGLEVETDRNGNIWAHWGTRGHGTIAIGSHLDSVPGGGAYDGPLGVTSSLAAVSALMDEGFVPARPVTIAAFGEEEGSRFGIACLGSKLMAGTLPGDKVAALVDETGVTYAEACRADGIDPAGLGRDQERLANLAAFVELHVEQGVGLADLDAPVAVASSILAHGRWKLVFSGEGNHAGATRMRDRRDPVAAMAAAVLAAQRIASSHDGAESARATIGRLTPIPGGTNVIASRVDAWLDVRGDTEPQTRALLEEILAASNAAAEEHGCTLEVTEESYVSTVHFDPDLQQRLTDALGGVPVLATGAGHDAGVLAAEIPTAMLFTRNPTGVSHSPFETATDEDCRAGARALTEVIRLLASEPRG
ncbi:allantoate amidohydrolase [Nocardioides albus]|uniref:N-carbamoyl-L-amino-acid hydrolase n=1 Tax=Nocardioides albus TaxID=1841 RepID=A0A7W5A5K4_9ACTN|nr:allantoate amidohydrolase [Nocardioides albus]MBB3090136.1 N-carbamoyl-L-amino-acid hydrolase [Nocardioides albus]GGU27922.1 Zn-dependent hydrolase [Nocardioides albus]